MSTAWDGPVKTIGCVAKTAANCVARNKALVATATRSKLPLVTPSTYNFASISKSIVKDLVPVVTKIANNTVLSTKCSSNAVSNRPGPLHVHGNGGARLSFPFCCFTLIVHVDVFIGVGVLLWVWCVEVSNELLHLWTLLLWLKHLCADLSRKNSHLGSLWPTPIVLLFLSNDLSVQVRNESHMDLEMFSLLDRRSRTRGGGGEAGGASPSGRRGQQPRPGGGGRRAARNSPAPCWLLTAAGLRRRRRRRGKMQVGHEQRQRDGADHQVEAPENGPGRGQK